MNFTPLIFIYSTNNRQYTRWCPIGKSAFLNIGSERLLLCYLNISRAVMSHRPLCKLLCDKRKRINNQGITDTNLKKSCVTLYSAPWRLIKYGHCREHFVHAPSQWETTLQCNVVSHWLSAFTKLSLVQGYFQTRLWPTLGPKYIQIQMHMRYRYPKG